MSSATDPNETARPPGAGLKRGQAEEVVARLSALTQAARVFGSGVADVDLDISWSAAGAPERMLWVVGKGGRRRVELRLDLDRMVAAVGPTADEAHAVPIEGFQSAFLHELGHVLYSGRPPGEPLLDQQQCETFASGLSEEARTLARQPSVRLLLNTVGDVLEDARVERRLVDRFRGARRYLRAHAAEALEMARGETLGLGSPTTAPGRLAARSPGSQGLPAVLGPGDEMALGGCAGAGEAEGAPNTGEVGGQADAGGSSVAPGSRETRELAQAVALLYLNIAGLEDQVPADAVPADAAAIASRLRASLLDAACADDPERLAEWLVTDLLIELAQSFPEVFEPGPPGPDRGPTRADTGPQDEPTARADEAQEDGDRRTEDEGSRDPEPSPTPENTQEAAAQLLEEMAERLMSPGLLGSGARVGTAGDGLTRRETPLEPRLIVYPHMDGTLIVDEVPVANARSVVATPQARQVIEQVERRYGPPALEAFAAERAALRRAFEVNYEQRFAGRYRSGRRVGVRNLRRMAVSRDLRLFQKLEIPDRLSYYFHLLIDVSPSMLTDRNAAKAIAVGYAFAESLDRLRIPVDVSLYSAAVTELYDHRRDRLDLFFSSDFGYYSSGTHEIEAIAYAKQKADAIDQTRKLIVVLTDGHPNSVALHRAGSTDLRTYYRTALIPWLRASHIDLLAIGIGHSPAYHEKAVSIGSSWESIGVFMELLDGVVAEGRKSHAALWQ